MGIENKRAAERVQILGELQGDMKVFQPMHVREISGSGVTIETQFPLHVDSLHDVRLSLGDLSVVIKGRVVHSHVSNIEQGAVAYRAGLELVDPSPTVTSAPQLDRTRTAQFRTAHLSQSPPTVHLLFARPTVCARSPHASHSRASPRISPMRSCTSWHVRVLCRVRVARRLTGSMHKFPHDLDAR